MKKKDAEQTTEVVVITGASGGIGRACALAFAKKGCHVVVNYNTNKEKAKEVVKEIKHAGHPKAIYVQSDISTDEGAKFLVKSALDEFGRIDYLVNNAGWTKAALPHSDLDLLTDELMDKVLATNVKGPIYVIRAAIDALVASGRGSVVNISSTSATTGLGSSIIYGGSKAALSTMTTSFARAYAKKVRFNCVAPGFVNTGFFTPVKGKIANKIQEYNASKNCIGKAVTAEEVAEVVVFFCSNGCILTGEEIVVDGGIVKVGALH